jgi:hypothetical protein
MSSHKSVNAKGPDNTSSTTAKSEGDDDKVPSTSVSRLLGIYSDLQAISGGSRSNVMEVVDEIAREYAGIDRIRQIYNNICGVSRDLHCRDAGILSLTHIYVLYCEGR